MRDRIIYLMSGPAHLPYLVCSLYTLRKHWAGDVYVYAWPESFEQVSRIAEERMLFVDHVGLRRPEYRGKNDQFLDKIRLAQSLVGEADRMLYLDADTTIHGALQPMFVALNQSSFVATQFCQWVSTGGIITRRIERLKAFPQISASAIELLLTHPYPSVNGGVWSCRPESAVLQLWMEWTDVAKQDVFIADEAVLHLMQVFYPPESFRVMTGGRWNCSPKYKPANLEDVVIWHYHGDSNVRPDKSKFGHDQWWPLWQWCWENNVGGCREWWPVVQADRKLQNKWMKRLEERWLGSTI